jgi:hypothetical protein
MCLKSLENRNKTAASNIQPKVCPGNGRKEKKN